MNQIQIWERVLKWKLAKNPELHTNFSNDDFNTLKNTIKFHNLTLYNSFGKTFL